MIKNKNIIITAPDVWDQKVIFFPLSENTDYFTVIKSNFKNIYYTGSLLINPGLKFYLEVTCENWNINFNGFLNMSSLPVIETFKNIQIK